MKIFISKIKALEYAIKTQTPEIVGQEAVSHYREGFRKEGFTDARLEKWQDVQRRTNPRDPTKASARRPILTRSGELGNSIRYRRTSDGVMIYSDKKYAEVHNSGGRAGRGDGFDMPQRQFIGKSEKLTDKINKKIAQHFNKIMK